ncbi:MAG: L,D-transpeptidase [Eggerthellaceae bacterium]
MVKKVLSTVLAVVLAAGLCPALALAEVTSGTTAQPQTAELSPLEGEEISYTVKYVDANDHSVNVADPDTKTGVPGTTMETAVEVAGYKCVSPETQTLAQGQTEIVFEYRRIIDVTVNCMKVNGEPVQLPVTETGLEGQELTVEAPSVEAYSPESKTQVITPEYGKDNQVTFYYLADVEYTVNYFLYKDGYTKTKVATSKQIMGSDGKTYTAKAADLFGYKLLSAASKEITLEEGGTNVVNFYYKKLPQKLSFQVSTYVYYNHKIYTTRATTNKSAAQATLSDRLAQECAGRMVGFRIKNTSQAIRGDIKYQMYQRGKGWTDWKSGTTAGSYKNEKKNYSGQIFRVKLTEEFAQKFDVYYRGKIFGVGWTGWAKNGQACGALFDYAVHLRGIQVKILPKGSKAPGTTQFRYVNEGDKETFAKAVLYNKIQNKASRSKYIISINTELGRVAVYQGSKGKWKRIKYWKCTSGMSGHLTPHGGYNVGNRGLHFGETHTHRGYYYTAWYWTQIKGGVLFHSVLYRAYSQTVQLPGGRGYGLGKRESGGCIRLEKANAYWIYTKIPRGTDVWIF